MSTKLRKQQCPLKTINSPWMMSMWMRWRNFVGRVIDFTFGIFLIANNNIVWAGVNFWWWSYHDWKQLWCPSSCRADYIWISCEVHWGWNCCHPCNVLGWDIPWTDIRESVQVLVYFLEKNSLGERTWLVLGLGLGYWWWWWIGGGRFSWRDTFDRRICGILILW